VTMSEVWGVSYSEVETNSIATPSIEMNKHI